MRIRRAEPSDFPTTATVSVDAFSNDELYQYTHPYAARYPSSFRNSFLRRYKLRNVLPGYIIWVAVMEEVDSLDKLAPVGRGQASKGPAETIVGYAIWRRYGESREAKRWQKQSWSEWFESILLRVEDNYIDNFKLDRSISPSRMRSLEQAGFSSDKFADLSERWHLHDLVVNPVYQRRGIGARLIVWGIEQATEEKVPVTLSASTVAEPLYRKMGFKTWKLTDLPGVRMGAPSLIWWPEVLTATEAVKK